MRRSDWEVTKEPWVKNKIHKGKNEEFRGKCKTKFEDKSTQYRSLVFVFVLNNIKSRLFLLFLHVWCCWFKVFSSLTFQSVRPIQQSNEHSRSVLISYFSLVHFIFLLFQWFWILFYFQFCTRWFKFNPSNRNRLSNLSLKFRNDIIGLRCHFA